MALCSTVAQGIRRECYLAENIKNVKIPSYHRINENVY